jgi:hypothetical protein
MVANDASGSSDSSSDTAAVYLISTLGAILAASSTSEPDISLLSRMDRCGAYQLRLPDKPLLDRQRLALLEPLRQP